MTGQLPAWLAALTIAAGRAPPTPSPPTTPTTPEISETPVTQSETPEPPESAPHVTDTESEIVREILAVSAVVRRYIKAVTAKNEAEEAQFTCGKKHPSLLWISAEGRRITLLAVTAISIEQTVMAIVNIQVEGKPPSSLTLNKVGGAWCVSP